MTAFGQIRGQIRIDAAQAIAEYASVRAANASTVAALRSASTAFITVGLGMAAAGAGLLALFGKAVTAAAQFEKKIDFFGAVTDASAADMQKVADKAIQMGKTTIFSANQMADAFVEFGKAGVSTKDIIGGVADAVVALASAADISLTDASDIIISTMQTFKIGAAGTTHIADLLAGAANSSIVEVRDLGVSLKYVGGIAAATGIPLENVVTTLALLGKAGIDGSTAGTSLRQILVSLNATSKRSQNELKKLGIITKNNTNLFIDQKGHLKPLDQVFQILQDHTKNLTDAQRLSALKIIFNNRALAAANILLKDGTKGFTDMSKAIGKISAADVAKRRLDNLAGDFLKFKNTVQTFLIQAGTPFQNFMRGIVQGLTRFVNFFGSLPRGVQTTTFAIIGVLGVLLTLGGILALTVGIVLRCVVAFKALRTALILLRAAAIITSESFVAMWVAIFGPVALAVAIFVAIVAVITLLYFKVKAVRNIVDAVGRAMVTAFKAVVNFFKGLPAFFEGVWNKITSTVTGAWDKVTSTIMNAINSVLNFIKSVWGQITNAIVTPIQATVGVLSRFWDHLFGIFSTGVRNVVAFVQRNWRVLILVFQQFGVIIDIITAHWRGIVTVFTAGLNAVKAVVMAVFNFLKNFIMATMQAIVTVVQLEWNGIKTIAAAVWNGVKAVVVPIINAIVLFFRVQFNAMRFIASAAWNAILAIARAVWAAIRAVISAHVNAIMAVVRTLQRIVSIVSSIFSRVYSTIAGAVGRIVGLMSGFVGRVVSAIGNVVGPMLRIGKQLIDSIYNGIIGAVGQIWQFFSGLVSAILRNVGDAASALFQVGVQLIQGLINGIGSMVGAAVSAVKNAVGSVIGGAKSLLGIHSPSTVFHWVGRMTVLGLVNGINKTRHLAEKAFRSLKSSVQVNTGDLAGSFSATRDLSNVNGRGSGSPPPVIVQGGAKQEFHVTLRVDMDKVSSVSKLLDVVNSIPQAARSM